MMTDDGGRKRFILLLASFFLVAGLVFGAYELFKYKFTADEVTGVPTAPTNVTAVDNAERTAITLSWSDVEDSTATDYKIERSASIWHPFAEIYSQSSSLDKTYTDTGTNFITGQRYYYRIKGYKAPNGSVYSRIVTPTRTEYKDYMAGMGEMETSFMTYQQTETVTNTVDNTDTPDNRVASTWMGYHDSSLIPQDDFYYRIEEGTGIAGTKQQCFAVKENNKTSSRIILRFSLESGKTINAKEFSNGDKIKFVLDKLSYKSADNLPAGVIRNFSYYLRMNGVRVPEESPPDFSKTEPDLPKSLNNEYTIQDQGDPTKTVKQFEISFEINIANSNLLRADDTPGICLDGAHFYIQKAGQDYTTVEVPAREEHVQNGYLSHAESNLDDPYYIASRYDHVSMAYAKDDMRLPAKYFNPNIKFFMYTARSISDYRMVVGQDPENPSMPAENNIVKILTDHPKWFYSYLPDKLKPPSEDTRKFKVWPNGSTSLDFVFDDSYQSEYLNNISDDLNPDTPAVSYREDFGNWWKVETARLANKRAFDGVFIDVAAQRTVAYIKKDPTYVCTAPFTETTVTKKVDGVDTKFDGCIVYNATSEQSRKLLIDVIPYLKSQGLLVTMNCGGCHLGDVTNHTDTPTNADRFFDSRESSAYTFTDIPGRTETNNATNTPDSHFQEHAFFGITPSEGFNNFNSYRWIPEWNNTIEDMQKYAIINDGNVSLTGLPESQKKINYISSYGFNKTTTDDNGKLPDLLEKKPTSAEQSASLDNYDTGWARHVLASYLMGSNKYTYLSIVYDDWIIDDDPLKSHNSRKEYPLDNAILDRLGQPDGGRKIQYNGIEYENNDPALDPQVEGPTYEIYYDRRRAVNFRKFANGLVVDNADPGDRYDPDRTHTFVMPDNYIDEYGRKYVKGSTINLQKRTGRIFFKVEKLESPSVTTARTMTYKDKATLSGTADIFASSVKTNTETAILDLGSHNWVSSVSLNIGQNDISVVAHHAEIPSSDSKTISITRRMIGDTNGNNSSVDKYDFAGLMLNWNKFEFANPADFNEDGSVGNIDFSMMMLYWGK